MCASRSCGHRTLFKGGRSDGREVAEVELAEHGQNLCIENRRTGRTAHRVMRQQRELPVEDGAGTQASYGSRHAVAAIKVKLGLRARLTFRVHDRVQRCRRQMQALMA